MPTTTEAIRIFLAPINEPVRGRWVSVDETDPTHEVRYHMATVREETGAEELRISDAEGLPSTLIPKYGGVPVQKIAAFVELADMHGLPAARAFVDALNLVGVVSSLPPEEWADAFRRSHAGVQDSVTAWAELRVTDGCYPQLAEVANELGLGYINIDRVRREMEMDSFTTFIDADDGTHMFYSEDI